MSGPLLWPAVAAAGAAGACARFAVDAAVSARLGAHGPWGTAVVNLTGAFAAGILAGLAPDRGIALVVGAGLLGAYTTFSTWMIETALLARVRGHRAAVVNVAGQVAAGLALAAAGWAIGAAI